MATSSPRAPGVDWSDAHGRLARAGEAIARLLEPDADTARRLMDERAKQLARPLARAVSRGESLDLACFSAGGEELAIETRYVIKVASLPAIEPIPWLSSVFLGVLNHQGSVLPVVDVHALLSGAASSERHEQMLVLGDGQPEFVIVITSAEEVIRIDVEEIAAPDAIEQASFVRGILAGRRLVLRGDALMRDPRLFSAGDSHATDDK